MKEFTALITEQACEEVTEMTVIFLIICMSFADELKILDKKIVLNSMSLKWNLIVDEFKNLTKNLNFN